MALSCFPNISKQIELGDGTRYGYVYVAASASKPTFLLLHGFPSASHDWRHQVRALSARRFGVLAPDLLGYGDTDSPVEVEAYSQKRMSDHIAEILTKEGIEKVIGVGHDWGCGLLSRLYTWHAECLASLVFISVGYIEPTATAMDVDAMNAMTEQHFGYSTFGYWKLFITEEAGKLMDSHGESTTSLVYPTDPKDWKTNLGPVGAAEAWIASDKKSPWPKWLTAEEAATHTEVMAKKGYTGPLNWYKSAIQGTSDLALHASLPEERKYVNVPTLLILGKRDHITHPDLQKKTQTDGTAKWVKQLRIEELDCGHWVQLEVPDKLNQLLEEFAEEGMGGVGQ